MSHRSLAPIMLLTALCAAPSTAAVVELRESAHLDEERIVLGRVAEIEAVAAPTGEAAEEGVPLTELLAEIDLGPAPLPGDSRRLTAGYIKMRLRRSGVNCGDLTFEGADAVRVHRPAPTAPEAAASVEGEDAQGGAVEAPPPVEVRRGARLHLTVAHGAVVIGAEATLLEDAVVGGRARLRVHQTRETVIAQIVGPTEAVIRGSEVGSCAH